VPDIKFKSKEELLQQPRLAFEVPSGQAIFQACTFTAIDPLAGAKEITTMIGNEICVISGLQRTHTDDHDGRKLKISHVESQYSHVEDSRKSTTIYVVYNDTRAHVS